MRLLLPGQWFWDPARDRCSDAFPVTSNEDTTRSDPPLLVTDKKIVSVPRTGVSRLSEAAGQATVMDMLGTNCG